MTDHTHSKHILLVKENVLVAHDSHYAGGMHLFSSLVKSVSKTWTVHVFTSAKKALVMHYALLHGLLGSLCIQSIQPEIITWQSTDGIRFYVAIKPEDATGSLTNKPCCPRRALVEAVAVAAEKLKYQCSVLLDVDSLQHEFVLGPATATEGSDSNEQQQLQQPFMSALVQRLNQVPRLLVLVQNIHHLPFGPCGTAPKTPQVLEAWQQVCGVLCVSNFVANYMTQHALPLLPKLQTGSSSGLFVMHPAALGAFGQGPFTDLGQAGAERMWGVAISNTPNSLQQQQQQQQQQQEFQSAVGFQEEQKQRDNQQQEQEQQQQWHHPPVVGMLKLTQEKGAELFFKLASRLPSLNFVAVCADAETQQQAASAGLPNLTLVPPVADVGEVLQQMSVVLVPSVLHEAFGMVVLDAQLRGVPVIVADAGALPEVAAGCAPVLPVRLAEFPASTELAAAAAAAAATGSTAAVPASASAATAAAAAAAAAFSQSDGSGFVCSSNGQQHIEQHLGINDKQLSTSWRQQRRRWQDRVFPVQGEQQLDTWAAAVQQLLSSREVYLHHSGRSKAVAERVVQPAAADCLLQQLLSWLGDT